MTHESNLKTIVFAVDGFSMVIITERDGLHSYDYVTTTDSVNKESAK